MFNEIMCHEKISKYAVRVAQALRDLKSCQVGKEQNIILSIVTYTSSILDYEMTEELRLEVIMFVELVGEEFKQNFDRNHDKIDELVNDWKKRLGQKEYEIMASELDSNRDDVFKEEVENQLSKIGMMHNENSIDTEEVKSCISALNQLEDIILIGKKTGKLSEKNADEFLRKTNLYRESFNIKLRTADYIMNSSFGLW